MRENKHCCIVTTSLYKVLQRQQKLVMCIVRLTIIYFSLTIDNLFPGINGWLPPRLAMEIVHNRTVNLHGGFGMNISMDLMC